MLVRTLFRRRRRRDPQLVLVSLIDVILQMLIFLILTTTFKGTPETRPVEYSPPLGEGVTVSDRVLLEINGSGTLFFDRRQIAWPELDEAFRNAAAAGTGRTVLIAASHSIPHGRVLDLLESAHRHLFFQTSLSSLEEGSFPSVPLRGDEQ